MKCISIINYNIHNGSILKNKYIYYNSVNIGHSVIAIRNILIHITY